MGYNTTFKGRLTFATEPTVKQLAALGELLGEDARDHPEWEPRGDASYIDLKMAADFSGVEWALVMDEAGTASKREIVVSGQRVKCPDCGHKFIVEGTTP
jgi:hypothetical protein